MPLLRNAALLRPFLAVAREGNLSAAARALAISQPALTKSIQKLEQQFGVALFERRARGMSLTPSGAALANHAKRIEAQCRFADAELEALALGQGGRIRIGAGTYWGAALMPRAIARLQERLPRLRVDLEVGVNSVILPKLFAGDLDFVMSALPDPVDLPPGIEMRNFGEFHLRVVAGKQHPLQRKSRLVASDLAPYPWVIYQHDRDVLTKLSAVLREHGGEPPNLLVETTSLHAVMQLLKSGPYLACLADAFVNALAEPDVSIVNFRREIWSFPSGAMYHASLRDAAPVSELLDALVDVSRSRAAIKRSGRTR